MNAPAPTTVSPAAPPRRAPSRLALGIALTCVVVLGAAWLVPRGSALGAPHTDLVGQFIAWRAFAADNLRAGNVPLWNPYTYAGQPFLGGFQSALLYPPNALVAFLPLDRALNVSVFAHLAVLGWGLAYWARRRGLHPAAGGIAGFAVALSGAVWPHVYAGHHSNLATMAWVPWAFAGLEAWSRERDRRGLFLASAAIALQILAGQIQYVFFFGVAAGVHALMLMALEPAMRRRALLGVALACVAAALLTAAQVLPGLEAGAEGVRQGKVDYRFASAFALPPENLLTTVAPGFFGDADRGAHPYWGRCYPWEMSVYFGVAGLFFGVAALWDREQRVRVRADWLVAALLIVLALGRHTPLYGLLYNHVPGFGQFRGMSKFTFPALLFLLLAAAAGLDAWLRGRFDPKRLGLAALAAVAVLALGGIALRFGPGAVDRIFAWVQAHANDDIIGPPTYPAGAAAHAANSLLRAAGVCLVVGLCLVGARRFGALRWLVLAVLPLELIDFARGHFATTTVATAMPAELREFVAKNSGDYRVLNLARPNNGHLLGAPDLWGNDPGVLKRYAEFMTFTQGGDPAKATQNVVFRGVPPLYAMLRARYAFVPTASGVEVKTLPDPLPRALFVTDYRVLAGRDALFAAMAAPGFDPRKTVLLETEPTPRPQPAAAPGTARVTIVDTDTLTIEAELSAPAILLLTDLHSRGWSARAVAGSAQPRYDVMPANYILQAIPLAAGHHQIRLEYRPRTLTPGIAISVVAWLAWAGGLVVISRRA